ncbi:MAG TPA: hypothetical protein VF463_20155 [Sphingobium sp.]
MLIRNIFQGLAVALPLLACACSHTDEFPDAPRIVGDSPADVALSITRIKARLDPDKQVEFGHAVMTLALVSPDKNDARAVGNMTPHFAQMVKGRNADQIIQLAALYRASIPADRP